MQNRLSVGFRTLRLLAVSIVFLLNGCAQLSLKNTTEVIDCDRTGSSCHSGRFNAIWTVFNDTGKQKEALSGRYEWQSGITGSSQTNRSLFQSPYKRYELQLNSSLGPALALMTSNSQVYSLALPDRRIFEADNWQSLFDLIFPFSIPADSLIAWLEQPRATDLPTLPKGWRWVVENNRYRLLYETQQMTGRIDLIPDTP